MIGFLHPNPMLPTLFLLSVRRCTCPLRNRMKRLCSIFSTKATLGELPMPAGRDAPKSGLGTGIVEALTKSLNADIELSDAGPGTAVTIRHRESAGLRTDFSTAAQEPNGLRNAIPAKPTRLAPPI